MVRELVCAWEPMVMEMVWDLVAVVLVLMGSKAVSPVVGWAYALVELQALAME